MKKTLLILTIGLVIFTAIPLLAAGKSAPQKTVNLYATNTADAWGKIKYNASGSTFGFSFTGIAPIANDWYALVLGEDPLNHPESTVIIDYPRSGGDTGEINITQNIEINRDFKKAKVWLIWARDITTDGGYTTITGWVGWHPQYYLFGKNRINYNDTDIR